MQQHTTYCFFYSLQTFQKVTAGGTISHSRCYTRNENPTRPQDRCDDATEPEPVLLQGARSAVMTTVALLSRAVLFGLNNTRLVKDERHAQLVDLVRHRYVRHRAAWIVRQALLN